MRKGSGCSTRVWSIDEGKGLVPEIAKRSRLRTGERLVTEKNMVMASIIRMVSLSKMSQRKIKTR